MTNEVALSGGRITKSVVRKGNCVYRTCCKNSVFMHRVLHWLEKNYRHIHTVFVDYQSD